LKIGRREKTAAQSRSITWVCAISYSSGYLSEVLVERERRMKPKFATIGKSLRLEAEEQR